MIFRWEKLGLVFEPQRHGTARPWMAEFAQAPATLLFDDFLRVYFSCRPPRDANGMYVSRSAFVDLDRSNPMRVLRVSEEPVLELGGPGTFDEFGTYPISVLNRNQQIWAYYAGWTRCESVPFNVAIGAAVSGDGGKTFKKLGPGPVLSFSPDEPFVISGPKVRQFDDALYLWYIAGRKWLVHDGRPDPVYKIRMATSRDGMLWSKVNRDLIPDRLGDEEAQASPDVFFFDGKYHMFFCFRQGTDFRNSARGYRIGYASSTNLLDWTRNDDLAGIDVSGEGWDSESISYPHVFELEGTVYMAYLGNEVGRYGFGLARLEMTAAGS